MTDDSYEARVHQQLGQYDGVENIHDLPRIFHYWSNLHLVPKMIEVFGTADPVAVFVDAMRSVKSNGPLRFLSVGAGDCSVEMDVVERLRDLGVGLLVECLDLSPDQSRAWNAGSAKRGLEDHLCASVTDINNWRAEHQFDGVIAHHSLHHIVNLELLFDEILGCSTSWRGVRNFRHHRAQRSHAVARGSRYRRGNFGKRP